MESTTVAILIAVAAFAVFGVLYAVFGARRGKASGETDRTWCLPQGHGDIDVTGDGPEVAPRDTCAPAPADERSVKPAEEGARLDERMRRERERELVR
jgi:hypothetical protein